jgi:antitoxin VapB
MGRNGKDDVENTEPAKNPLWDYLEKHVWPTVPANELGRVLTRDEEDDILGFGAEGY